MGRRAGALALVLVVALAAAIFGLDAVGGQFGPTGGLPQSPSASGAPATVVSPSVPPGSQRSLPPTGPVVSASVPAVDPLGGLRTIREASLPKEARLTLALIATGGPFPYSEDGSTFRNLERLLPIRATNYYREYTVDTPGSPDRGARRIVTGRDGDKYWTVDHYGSFRRIVP